MFFVTADHRVYGPYWNRDAANTVRDSIVDQYSKMGFACCRTDEIVMTDQPVMTVDVVERQIIRDIPRNKQDWEEHRFL